MRFGTNQNEMKRFLLILLVFKFHTITETLDLADIGKSATDVAKGVIEKIPGKVGIIMDFLGDLIFN